MRVLPVIIVLVLAVAIVALPGCAAADKDIVSKTGMIKFIELEGGFYGITGDDGKNYDPINLVQEFRQDGLRVRFELKELKDVATIRMWGTPVEIIKMEQLRENGILPHLYH